MLTGRCLCGTVRYEIAGSPSWMYHCHCAQCRHACGSTFATNIIVRAGELAIVAGADALASYESSPGKARHFCSRCGSPIFSRSQASSEFVSVRAGTLDGDPGVRPSVHIFVTSRAPWYDVCDDLPQKAEGLFS